jgi:polysaccharide export outer membrane protein
MVVRSVLFGALVIAVFLPRAAGQDSAAASPGATPVSPSPSAVAGYVLGPDDVITLHVMDGEEFSDKPVRVDMAGYIRLPMIGRLRAGGLTADQLEAELKERLREYIRNPDVTVSITDFRSQPVSVIGSVKNPGVHQLQGRKTLVEVLSLAGGLATDAGYTVKITRRIEYGPIPLPGAEIDQAGRFSVAEVKLKSLLSAENPAQNVFVCPNDVISVPRAEMVYVVGQVVRAGGFVLNERETISVLQALSLAGGVDSMAAPQNAHILRASVGKASRAELPVDLKKILAGTAEDVTMKSEDILFVPANVSKKAAVRGIEAAIQMVTGLVIWRR